jgi:acyl-CoA thioesterase-1
MMIFSFSKKTILLACSVLAFQNCQQNNASTKAPDVAVTEKKEAVKSDKKNILFFGDSLSAAYGIEPAQGFVSIIGKRIDSLAMPYVVTNAGLSGETTAAGKERVDWILKQKVDVFILELGGNDALRGIKPDATYQNLQAIVNKVKTTYPSCKIVLAGMYSPANMGATYSKAFKANYPALAKANNLTLIPFLLENVGGEAKLNQADGIHPTPEGHKIVAETVWKTLKTII